MKIVLRKFVPVMVLAVFAGCQSAPQNSAPVQSKSAAPVQSKDNAPVQNVHVVSVPRAAVSIAGDGDDVEIAAQPVITSLSDELAAAGFLVTDAAGMEATSVRGRILITGKTHRGERIVFRGTLAVSIYKSAPDVRRSGKRTVGDLIASKTFEAACPEAYSAKEGLCKLGGVLGAKARIWVGEKMKTLKTPVSANK